MTRLPLIALLATAACAQAVPDRASVIVHTTHVNARVPQNFDEGTGARGVIATYETPAGEVSYSIYDHSFHGNALGYSVGFQPEALTLRYGDFSGGLVGVVSRYPDEPTAALEATNGFFGMAGVNLRYDLGRVHVGATVFPSAIRDGVYSFDALAMAYVGVNH